MPVEQITMKATKAVEEILSRGSVNTKELYD